MNRIFEGYLNTLYRNRRRYRKDLLIAYKELVEGVDYNIVKARFIYRTGADHSIAGMITFYGRKMVDLKMPSVEVLEMQLDNKIKLDKEARERNKNRKRDPIFFPFQGGKTNLLYLIIPGGIALIYLALYGVNVYYGGIA